MQQPRSRLTVGRMMVAMAVMALAAWLWVCFFSEIDPYEAMIYLTTGCCFLSTVLGISVPVVLVMLMSPSDPPPRPGRLFSSPPEKYPQFRIRTLMIVIAVVAVALALFGLASRLALP